MKKPYECTDLQESQNLCFYWMYKAQQYHTEIETIYKILENNRIHLDKEFVNKMMNEKIIEKKGDL